MNLNRFPILYIIVLLVVSCSKNFHELDPGLVYSGEVRLPESENKIISSPFLYSVPRNYDPDNSCPLIIALHGYGSSSEAFFGVMKEAANSSGFVLLVPQGEIPAQGGIGYGWGSHSEGIIRTALTAVEKEANIDRLRIYLLGFSDGGYQSCIIAGRNSLVFRGFASICAPLNSDTLISFPLLNSNARAYISCGELETRIKDLSQETVKVLRTKGYNTRYIEYKNTGHGIPDPINSELTKILKFLDDK